MLFDQLIKNGRVGGVYGTNGWIFRKTPSIEDKEKVTAGRIHS
jgi:hypothetical protein